MQIALTLCASRSTKKSKVTNSQLNRIISVSICMSTFLTMSGQNPTTTRIEKIKRLIPDQFEILDFKFGHLDNDTLTDAVVILKSKFEEVEDSTQRDRYRPLLILLQQKNKSFKLAKRNDHVVLCKNCGGTFVDPFGGLSIENKSFEIIFFGGSRYKWTRLIRFNYEINLKNWILVEDSGSVYDGLQLDTIEYPKDIVYTKTDNMKVTIDNYKGDD